MAGWLAGWMDGWMDGWMEAPYESPRVGDADDITGNSPAAAPRRPNKRWANPSTIPRRSQGAEADSRHTRSLSHFHRSGSLVFKCSFILLADQPSPSRPPPCMYAYSTQHHKKAQMYLYMCIVYTYEECTCTYPPLPLYVALYKRVGTVALRTRAVLCVNLCSGAGGRPGAYVANNVGTMRALHAEQRPVWNVLGASILVYLQSVSSVCTRVVVAWSEQALQEWQYCLVICTHDKRRGALSSAECLFTNRLGLG